MISGCGRSAGAVIPALGSGRYSPGPHIVLPSWRKGSALNFTTNVVWGQPGALATVSKIHTPDVQEPVAEPTQNCAHRPFDCGVAVYFCRAGESTNLCQPDAR